MRREQKQVSRTISNSTRVLCWLISCAAMIRILFVTRLLPDGLFDDAYITFRYAANLMSGAGFVFNNGERVLGTTSPLFAIILAAGGRVVGVRHLEELAVAVGILASLGTLYVCENILNVAGVPQAVKWTFLVMLAFLPSFISNSTSGMSAVFGR